MLYSNRASVIAVGVEKYEFMPKLSGPSKDVEKIKKLLSDDFETALYKGNRFTQLIDPKSDQLRKTIVDYAMDRSAPNDILVFYFSGHGVIIGHNDLGICAVDTQIHPEFKIPVPLNLIRFSDIIETLSAVKVDPVIIIDACFSGQGGEIIGRIYDQLKRNIQAETASSYALLCSSRKIEATPDHQEGGPFSSTLVNVANKGKDGKDYKRKKELTLKDLYSSIREEIEIMGLDIVPQLFIGDTLPDFGFVKNNKFKPLTTSITKGQLKVLNALWNNGNSKILSVDDFQKIGSTEHTTYNKLSYKPAWGLLEKVDSKKRRLSIRGIQFMKGELKIPKSIIKQDNEEWVPNTNAQLLGIEDFQKT
jgi:hypothetical protein